MMMYLTDYCDIQPLCLMIVFDDGVLVFDDDILGREQLGSVHPDGGQGWAGQEEEQDHLPEHHAGRLAGHPLPNVR